MDDMQKAAFLMSQTVCAMAEIAGMQAVNQFRVSNGNSIAYGEEAFAAVPDRFGIGHNAALTILLS